MGDRYEDGFERYQATPVQRAVAVIAAVLGVLGTGYGLFSLATTAISGALVSGMGGGIMGGTSGFMQAWTTISMVMGGLLAAVALVLSLLAFVSGLMGAITSRFTALRWTAALIVAFDLVAYVLWPIVNFVASIAVMRDLLGDDAVGLLAIPGVMMPGAMLVSVVLIVFWVITFMVCSRP